MQHQDPRGVLSEIRGRGVPPDSPNPDPISDQNMPFFTPVLDLKSIPAFRLGLAGDNFSTGFVVAQLSLASLPKSRIGKITARIIYFGWFSFSTIPLES